MAAMGIDFVNRVCNFLRYVDAAHGMVVRRSGPPEPIAYAPLTAAGGADGATLPVRIS